MLSLQPAAINGPELDTPQADRFAADDDPALGQEIFDIPMSQVFYRFDHPTLVVHL